MALAMAMGHGQGHGQGHGPKLIGWLCQRFFFFENWASGAQKRPKMDPKSRFLTNFVPGPQCLSLGPKTKKMRAEKPCKTPPPEFQMVPYGASYGQKPFWASQAPFWGHFSEQMVPKCRKGHQKSASRNSPGCSRLFPAFPVMWCQGVRGRPIHPHAPGVRMTVVTQTPSKYGITRGGALGGGGTFGKQ